MLAGLTGALLFGFGTITLAQHGPLTTGRELLVHLPFTSCRRCFAASARTGFDLTVTSITRARPPRPSALCVPLVFLI
jgi:hypothetical protein